MAFRLLFASFLSGLLCIGGAFATSVMPFVDGRWHGDLQTGQDSAGFECWASTMAADATSLTLGQRADGTWRLQLSSPGWRLPPSQQYAMVALVDFYPTLQLRAEARSQTLLEILDLEQIGLLAVIENGHTLTLTSDGFNGKYELEGSAKVIARIRDCFVAQLT